MKQSMKLAARILENLPAMSPDVMQGWIDNPKALSKFLAALEPDGQVAVEPKKSNDTSHLRFLESAIIGVTSGTTTLADAGDVFTGYLESDFKNWGTDVAGVDTEATPVDVYEMMRSGTFADIFGSFGVVLRSLCLSQGQIKEFPRTHRHLLQQDGYTTLFLFEVTGELFVARVSVDGGQLRASVYRFLHGSFWYADGRYRVVVPQLAI